MIREQTDLRRIFERKMQERQEFIDRYFVFATNQWDPPKDYTRANGLVEDIRQAYFAIDERIRLEEELKPRELHDHSPGEPIDLPGNLKSGKSKGQPASRPPSPSRPKRKDSPKKRVREPRERGSLSVEHEKTARLQSQSRSAPPLRVLPSRRNVNPQFVE